MRNILVGGAALVGGAILLGRQLRRYRFTGKRFEHVSETEESYRQARMRVLILGAGFGGLATALTLDQQLNQEDDCSVLVVDRDNDLLFTPLLWTAANGRTDPNNVVVPIRDFQRGRRFHVLHAEVEHIDLDRKEVHTSAGIRPYDRLVIALGSYTAVPDLPGLRAKAFPFYTPADAFELRNHLIDAIETAHQTEDVRERRAWLTFVISGAGDTGIELAAIVYDYLRSGLYRAYPWLVNEPVRIVVIGRSERVLPTSKPETSHLAQKVLEEEGIEVLAGTSVTGMSETVVETSAGPIPARTCFWAAGTAAPDIVRELPVQHARNGSIIVDDHLRITEHPEVYVIGDSAWAYDATGVAVPATAQAARLQGIYVGKSIAREYANRPTEPYRYKTLGHLALLGHYTGVAEVGPLTFGGFPAFLLWHMAYLFRNPSWTKRIRLVVDWLLSAVLGREIGQLRLFPEHIQHKIVLEKAPQLV